MILLRLTWAADHFAILFAERFQVQMILRNPQRLWKLLASLAGLVGSSLGHRDRHCGD
jgi:hypothetical protein